MSGPGSVFKPHFVFYMDDDWRVHLPMKLELLGRRWVRGVTRDAPRAEGGFTRTG